jgi:cytochrome c-type biogenesis protein CcmH/NrfG
MKINPESFAAAEGLAVVYVTLQRSDDAIHYARESIRLHPNQSEPWYTLGEALNQEGRVAEAANAFYVRYRLNSESPWAADDLARVLAEQHLDREAIYYFRRACALDPKFARSHRPLALLLAKTGRLEEAIQQFRSALLVDANDADLHLELAGALAKSGQIQEARRECLAALQIKPDLAPARDLLSSLSK